MLKKTGGGLKVKLKKGKKRGNSEHSSYSGCLKLNKIRIVSIKAILVF